MVKPSPITAPNVVAFPKKKPSFKAEKLDVKKIIEHYDDHRRHVALALSLLGKTPHNLKKGFADIEAIAKSGDSPNIRPNTLALLVKDTEKMVEYFRMLADVLEIAAGRLTLVDRKLI